MLTALKREKNKFTELTPEFSIITAVYNAEEYLVECLDSVSEQTYPHVQHTVIDGGSTDGSVELLTARSDLYYWHSRKDKGIADAFNAGIEHSTGNVILFLGADDRLFDAGVLAEYAEFLKQLPRPWFVYGDVVYAYETSSRIVRNNYSWPRFRKYNCLPHQAMVLDRWFFERYGAFDLSYKIAMDYEHTARFVRDFSPVYLPRVVSVMRRIGVSNEPLSAHKEMDRVKKKYHLAGFLARHLFFCGILLLYHFKRYVLRQQWS